MAKKKTEKPARYVSKQQLSHWQKQRQRQRLINAIGLFIIVAVVAVVGVGWYVSEYQPRHKIAIRVNDTKFNMQYYVDMLRLHSGGLSPEYLNILPDMVTKDIIRGELIRQGAAKLGFTVSNDDVTSELKKNKLPTDHVHEDMMQTQLLVKKMLDEYFDPKVPTIAEQRHILAMFLESEFQAKAIRNRITLGENFTDLAKESSLHEEAKTNKGDFGWHPKGIFTDFIAIKIAAEYAFEAEVGTLSQPLWDNNINKKLGYWLIQVLKRNVDNEGDAHVQAILAGSLEEADQVRARLLKGEDFATLAREFSQLEGVKENGGDLGPIKKGEKTAAFDQFAFNTDIPLKTLSPPIRDEESTTRGGYWLVKIVDKAGDRKITDEDRDLLKAKHFEDWVAELLLDPETKIDDSYLTSEKKAWAVLQMLR